MLCCGFEADGTNRSEDIFGSWFGVEALACRWDAGVLLRECWTGPAREKLNVLEFD